MPKAAKKTKGKLVRVNFSMLDTDRDRYQAEALKRGRMSLAAFARLAMDEKIEREAK